MGFFNMHGNEPPSHRRPLPSPAFRGLREHQRLVRPPVCRRDDSRADPRFTLLLRLALRARPPRRPYWERLANYLLTLKRPE